MHEIASTAVNSRSRSLTPSLITTSRRRRLRLTVITRRTNVVARRRSVDVHGDNDSRSPGVVCIDWTGVLMSPAKIAKRRRNSIEFLRLSDPAARAAVAVAAQSNKYLSHSVLYRTNKRY